MLRAGVLALAITASSLDEFDATQQVFSQQYTDGSDGRATHVRFLCPDSWRDEDGIVLVHEPRSKHYQINVRLHAICDAEATPATPTPPAPRARSPTGRRRKGGGAPSAATPARDVDEASDASDLV